MPSPCFIVRDANRQALAYVYCEEEPGRRVAAQAADRRPKRFLPSPKKGLIKWVWKPLTPNGEVFIAQAIIFPALIETAI
jgi:hypothetical protein